MTTVLNAPEELGYFLSDLYAQRSRPATVPAALEPATQTDAYVAQSAFMRRHLFKVGGWKIGSKSEDGAIHGAPLPLDGIHPGSATLSRGQFPVLGIELEIMFCFDSDLVPGSSAATEKDLVKDISSMAVAIEIVSSRLANWPDVSKLSQLADLQNHGALVAGQFVDYDKDFDFRHPQTQLRFNGRDIFNGPGGNPAGDPRRLLPWLIKHCKEQAIALPAGTVITTGSYTGMYFPAEPGTVVGQIAGLPPIQFEIR